jgi:hypothetical protein
MARTTSAGQVHADTASLMLGRLKRKKARLGIGVPRYCIQICRGVAECSKHLARGPKKVGYGIFREKGFEGLERDPDVKWYLGQFLAT